MAGLFRTLADRLMAPSPRLSAPSDPGAALCATRPDPLRPPDIAAQQRDTHTRQKNRMVHGGDEVSGTASRDPCGSGRPRPRRPSSHARARTRHKNPRLLQEENR